MAQYLVIQLARFGDIVQTKRLMLTLLAQGTVHLCVDASLAELARMVYPTAQVYSVLAHGSPQGQAFVHNTAVFARLEAMCFDKVYNLNHSGLNLALARLFAPDSVCGYAMYDGQAVHSPWVRMAFGWTEERRLAPLNLADFWAYFAPEPVPPSAVNPVAQGQGRGLGVVLAGRESRRSLPPHVLGPCVYAAFEALGGVPIYLFGTAAEKPLARQLLRHLPGVALDKVHNLAGRTQWQDLAQALTGLDALLTPDTGTMHLAAHLGVPVRAFFLSSAWCFETGPYGLGHRLWQAHTECVPCLESAPCVLHTACGQPFAGAAFLRSVARHVGADSLGKGRQQEWLREAASPLQEVMLVRSTLDALGTNWQKVDATVLSGTLDDAFAPRREALRLLLQEYVQAGQPNASGCACYPELVEKLYAESEWLLHPRDSIFAEFS